MILLATAAHIWILSFACLAGPGAEPTHDFCTLPPDFQFDQYYRTQGACEFMQQKVEAGGGTAECEEYAPVKANGEIR